MKKEKSLLERIVDSGEFLIGLGSGAGTVLLITGLIFPMSKWMRIAYLSSAAIEYGAVGYTYFNYWKIEKLSKK